MNPVRSLLPPGSHAETKTSAVNEGPAWTPDALRPDGQRTEPLAVGTLPRAALPRSHGRSLTAQGRWVGEEEQHPLGLAAGHRHRRSVSPADPSGRTWAG